MVGRFRLEERDVDAVGEEEDAGVAGAPEVGLVLADADDAAGVLGDAARAAQGLVEDLAPRQEPPRRGAQARGLGGRDVRAAAVQRDGAARAGLLRDADAELGDAPHRVAVDHVRRPLAQRAGEAGDERVAALAVEAGARRRRHRPPRVDGREAQDVEPVARFARRRAERGRREDADLVPGAHLGAGEVPDDLFRAAPVVEGKAAQDVRDPHRR